MPGLDLIRTGGSDPAALEQLEQITIRLDELEAMGGTGSFRGEYQGSVRLHGEAFADLGPAWTTHATASQDTVGLVSMASARGTDKPAEYTSALSLFRNGGSGASPPSVRAALDLSKIPALQGKNLTEVRFWFNLFRDFSGNIMTTLKVGGSELWLPAQPATDAVTPWAQVKIPTGSVSPNSTLEWAVAANSTSTAPRATLAIAGVEIFGTADPYMFDHYVIHNSQMWKSTIDNNPNEPGGPGWEPVALADLQDTEDRIAALEQRVTALETPGE